MSVTATRPTFHNKNSKYQNGAITLAAHRHNVDVLSDSATFLLFAVLVAWCRPCRRYRLF